MCCTRLARNTGRKKSPFWHHRTTLSGYIFGTKACIDNRKKIPPPHVLIIRWTWPTNGWDLLASLGHPCKFQRVSRLGSVTARHSSIGRQPNFAALNRERHLYSARRPSRWALAHISSCIRPIIVKTDKLKGCQTSLERIGGCSFLFHKPSARG